MSSKLLGGLLLVVLLIGGYFLLTMPDTRTTSQKVGDAVHDLDKGPEKAAKQLQSRTPGQKLGDEIKDSTSSDHN